jgi:hypothetical protein
MLVNIRRTSPTPLMLTTTVMAAKATPLNKSQTVQNNSHACIEFS